MMVTPVFEDACFGAMTFSSSDTSKPQMVHQGEQTNEIEVASTSTQMLSASTAETQTERNSERKSDPTILSGFDVWDGIPAGVDRFLVNAGAVMEDELDNADASQAFIGYAPLEEGQDNDITLHTTLSCDLSQLMGTRGTEGSKAKAKALQATGVDWNPTGSVVVASFGRNDIAGWCDSPGALATWSIFRRGFADEDEHVPDVILDHSSCLMCVSCHPVSPAIVAAGSFNGEVVVWDTARDDPLLATTKIDDLFHREPVTSMSWVYSSKDNDYRIAAVSGDGKLLFWSLKNNLRCPVEGYRIPSEGSMGGRNGMRSRGGPTGGRTVGCTSVSFLREGRRVTPALVGTEGGNVLKCRLLPSIKVAGCQGAADGVKSMQWSAEAEEVLSRVPSKQKKQVAKEIEYIARADRETEVNLTAIFRSRLESAMIYPSPGLFRMEKHHGPVHAIDCSPFHRALFLSTGADGSARLYNALQSRSVLTFEPSTSNLMDVQWSRVRPLVFAAVAGDGGIFVYDLLQSAVIPVASAHLPRGGASIVKAGMVDVNDRDACGAAYSIAFNPRQRDLLATGDSCGRVLIWRTSWRLANKRPGEDTGLDRLFKGSVEDEESREEGADT